MIDPASAIGVVSALKNAVDLVKQLKAIADTAKDQQIKSLTLDLHERILDLRGSIQDLKDENLQLREKNTALEAAEKQRKTMKPIDGVYYSEDNGVKDGPFCQACFDCEKKTIRLQDGSEYWICPIGSSHTVAKSGRSRRTSFLSDLNDEYDDLTGRS